MSLNYKTSEQFINNFNQKNFFEESRAVNLLLLNEANLAGTSKLENIKKITELCQRCLIYNWLQQKRKWNSEVSEGI